MGSGTFIISQVNDRYEEGLWKVDINRTTNYCTHVCVTVTDDPLWLVLPSFA